MGRFVSFIEYFVGEGSVVSDDRIEVETIEVVQIGLYTWIFGEWSGGFDLLQGGE